MSHIGVHKPTGKPFCRRIYTCGYCGRKFTQQLSNSCRPCPDCLSVRKVNHIEKAKQAWPTREVEPV